MRNSSQRPYHRFSPPALALSLAFFVRGSHALACGGGGITSEAGVVINAQHVLISSREQGSTDIVVQVDVPSASSNFGLLIPVPNEPTIDPEPVPSSELALLDSATAPEIVVDDGDGDGPLIGCGGNKSGDGSGGSMRVTSGQFIEVGPVTAVSLKGDSAAAVNTWLQDNGFVLPTADTETLERYVAAGSYFIAVKRNDRTIDGSASSIGLHYSLPGDHRMLSLGFAKIGADVEVAFTVFLAANTTTGPSAPFTALTLADLDGSELKDDYGTAVRNAVLENDSKAFVLESSTNVSDLAAQLPNLARLLDSGAVVTRATTIIPRDQLTTDAVFATPFTRDVRSSRTLSLAPAPSQPPAGWWGVVLFGALVSFPLRRRNT